MSGTPLRYCAEPGCPARVRVGRCAKHARSRDLARGSAQSRGYDYNWSRYSKLFLRQHPYCGEQADGSFSPRDSRCWREGRLVLAECTDHMTPLSRGGAKWDPQNHQALCRACNTVKGDALPLERSAP